MWLGDFIARFYVGKGCVFKMFPTKSFGYTSLVDTCLMVGDDSVILVVAHSLMVGDSFILVVAHSLMVGDDSVILVVSHSLMVGDDSVLLVVAHSLMVGDDSVLLVVTHGFWTFAWLYLRSMSCRKA